MKLIVLPSQDSHHGAFSGSVPPQDADLGTHVHAQTHVLAEQKNQRTCLSRDLSKTSASTRLGLHALSHRNVLQDVTSILSLLLHMVQGQDNVPCLLIICIRGCTPRGRDWCRGRCTALALAFSALALLACSARDRDVPPQLGGGHSAAKRAQLRWSNAPRLKPGRP